MEADDAMTERILIMTSTIAPARDAFQLKRTEPAERLEDYKAALRFYGRSLPTPLGTHRVNFLVGKN